MLDYVISFFFYFMWYSLVVMTILYAISGLDDLFFDCYYWIRYVSRLFRTRDYGALTYERLCTVPEKPVAILVACWHEANVIGAMLKNNCNRIDYSNYDIFVGVYPNDPETVAEVQAITKEIPNVHFVIGPVPGPSNKASNLNVIFDRIKQYENETGKHYEIIIFHDSEDIIHALEFKFYNYLIPRKNMVQIPVLPLEVDYFKFTHWLYADEFSENHTKDIIVREALGGLVPSAGVGTAFSRATINALAELHGVPFAEDTLTEDYHTALKVRLKGYKQIFASQYVKRMVWRKKWLLWGPYVKRCRNDYIATHSLFPMKYKAAVRQKARWITGIAIQEWFNSSWPGSWRVKFTLFHDRKSLVTHAFNGIGYLLFLFWVLYAIWEKVNPDFPSLQDQLNNHPWVWVLILICFFMMCERILQRFIAVYRIYGFIPALLSVPRVFYGNILNLHALLRAYWVIIFQTKKSQPLRWDKTDHVYPGSHVLIPYKSRIGDLLLKAKKISSEQLQMLIQEHYNTGEKVGNLAVKNHFISSQELTTILSEQYQLKTITPQEIVNLSKQNIGGITKRQMRWLQMHKCHLVATDNINHQLVIAIPDPSQEAMLRELINIFKQYQVTFMLLAEDTLPAVKEISS